MAQLDMFLGDESDNTFLKGLNKIQDGNLFICQIFSKSESDFT
jgi:hypothetical protein